jgi:hypothetical protein
LDESACACLDDGDIALVEIDRAGGGQAARQLAAPHDDRAQPQRLRRGRIDPHAGCLAPALVGIFGDELHIHERRFAWLVEVLRRHHRVIPVERFAAGIGCLLGCAFMSAEMGDAIACATGDEGERCGGKTQSGAR